MLLMDDLRESASRFCFTKLYMQNKNKGKKNETQIRRGQVDKKTDIPPAPCLLCYSKGLICANTSITQQQRKNVWHLYDENWNWKPFRSFNPKHMKRKNVILYFTMKCWIWNIFRYLKLFQMKILRFCLQFCNETLSFSETAHSTQIVKIKSFLWAHWLFVWAHCSMHKLNMSDKAETNAQGHVITLRAV